MTAEIYALIAGAILGIVMLVVSLTKNKHIEEHLANYPNHQVLYGDTHFWTMVIGTLCFMITVFIYFKVIHDGSLSITLPVLIWTVYDWLGHGLTTIIFSVLSIMLFVKGAQKTLDVQYTIKEDREEDHESV